MQDLTLTISSVAGLDPDTARKAAGIVLDFLQKRLAPAEAAAVIDAVPGGREAAAAAAEDEAEGGGSSALDLEGLANRLLAAGVLGGELERFGRAFFAGLRREAGEDAVRRVAAALPEVARLAA